MYRGQIARFLLARCGDPDLAEDVLQETFMRVLRNLDRFEPDRGDMRSWLFKIAQNTLRSETRRRYHGDKLTDELEHVVSSEPAVEDLIHDAMMRDGMERLIEELPASERRVLVACKLEGMTLREASYHLDMAERTISRKLFQALKRLRAAMLQSGYRPGS